MAKLIIPKRTVSCFRNAFCEVLLRSMSLCHANANNRLFIKTTKFMKQLPPTSGAALSTAVLTLGTSRLLLKYCYLSLCIGGVNI